MARRAWSKIVLATSQLSRVGSGKKGRIARLLRAVICIYLLVLFPTFFMIISSPEGTPIYQIGLSAAIASVMLSLLFILAMNFYWGR